MIDIMFTFYVHKPSMPLILSNSVFFPVFYLQKVLTIWKLDFSIMGLFFLSHSIEINIAW